MIEIAEPGKDPVEIVDYDPRWPSLFDAEAKRLRAALDPSLIVGLEHFGSTAIPGLSAETHHRHPDRCAVVGGRARGLYRAA